MLRSAFLSLFAPRRAHDAVPVDDARLNVFAVEYNRYVDGLRNGHIDARQWRRVLAAWTAIT